MFDRGFGGMFMVIPYILKSYVKYHKGKGFICGHVDALHATPPAADKYTDKLVEMLIKQVGCAGIISTVSRLDCDLNRIPNHDNQAGVAEYRKAINDILHYLHIVDLDNKLTTPYLHFSFHGMKDINYGPMAMEIGTQRGQSCSPEVSTWLKEKVKEGALHISPEIMIVFDNKFKGNESINAHRHGDQNGYTGYGQHFHSFQIELSKTIRRKYLSELSILFANIMQDFQTHFVTNSL